MHELIRLLNEFGADADLIALATRFLDPAEGAAPLTDAELASLDAALIAFHKDDEATGALLRECADAVVAVRTEVATREAAATEEDAENARQRARLANGGVDPDAPAAEGDGEGEEDAEDGAGDGDVEVAPGDEEGAAAEGSQEPVPVQASARPAARRVLRSGQPRSATERHEDGDPSVATMTFYADTPGFAAGSRADSLADVDRALLAAHDAFRLTGPTGFRRVPVARIDGHYPEERRLIDASGNPLSAAEAGARVQAAIQNALTASGNRLPNALRASAGGLCAMLQPYYGVESLGDDRQPVKNEALVGFQAARGGLISVAPPTITALSGSVGEWTLADDIAAAADTDPDDPTTPKDILDIDCGTQRTTQISGIYRRLRFRNIASMTFPEYQSAFTDLSLVWQARFAEQWRLAKIKAGSVQTTLQTTTTSATRDLLAHLARSAANERIHHRLPRTYPFRVILPEQLLEIIREDLSRTIPGGSQFENLVIAESQIVQFFTSRNLNVTWSPDMVVPDEQTAVHVYNWPTHVEAAMFPEGTWLDLDSGSIDLGVIRDSRTAAANTFQTFAEFFEGVHKLGVISLWHDINVCPSGAVSGTVDPAPLCASYT